MRLRARHFISAAVLAHAVFGMPTTAAKADSAADPFAKLEAVTPDQLSQLNGRQGAGMTMITNMLKGSQTFDIESANNSIEAGDMKSGLIGLNNSFTAARGVNNITANTGIGANIQNGLILLINMY